MDSVRLCSMASALCLLTAPCLAGSFDHVESDDFLHALEFEEDGVLPSIEGADDLWVENGAWNLDGEEPPFLKVEGDLAVFDTTGLGEGGGRFFNLEQPDLASGWGMEIDPSMSYTFEVRLRSTGGVDGVANGGVTNPGVSIWLANGADRALTVVRTDQIRWSIDPGEVIHEGDNASEFFNIRVAHHGPSGRYFIWRNSELIGRRLEAPASDPRVAVFLIDFGSSNECMGEFDYVRWEAGEVLAPPVDPSDTEAPAPPTGLVAEGEDGRVLLDWEDSGTDDVLCYNVYRSESAGGPHGLIKGGVVESEFIDDAVTNERTYSYVVRAVDTNDNVSEPSNEAQATPSAGVDVTPPAIPTGLSATAQSGSILLDWEDNLDDDLSGYVVRRSEVSGGPYTDIAEDVSESRYEDGSALLLTRYYYVVAAKDLAGNLSEPSAEANSILTTGIEEEIEKDSSEFAHALEFEEDGVPPSVEGADDGWVETGAWTEGPPPPYFEIEGGVARWDTTGLGQGGGRFFDFQQPNGASAWSSEVDPFSSYTFEVRLRVTGGVEGVANGGVTNPGATIWLANGVDRGLTVVRTDEVRWAISPDDVVLHEGDNSSEFVTLRVAHDGPSGTYSIFRNGALIGSDLVAPASDARTAVFLMDFGATNESAGEFDYVRWDSTGAYWPPIDPNDTTPPAPPTGLVAVPEDGRVLLSWNANTEDDLGSYEIGRSLSAGGPHTVIAQTGATSYADDGVQNGTTYYYVVMAVDVNRNTSDASEEVEATPEAGLDATPPAAPTGLQARVTLDGEVALTWNAGEDFDLDSYRVYRGTTSGGPYDLIAEGIQVFETEYLDDAVNLGTTYYYVVTALDFAGNESDPSLEIEATPEAFGDFPERAASSFAHQLHFETDGVLPSVEGADDGWLEGGAWVIDGEEPPSLEVTGGRLIFNTTGLGVGGGKAFDIHQPDGASAWSAGIDPSTSYTFEVRLSVDETDEQAVPNPGATIWLANGVDRALTRVMANQILWDINPGELLVDDDNSSEFVNVRVAYHAPSGKYFIWRDDQLVGEELEPPAGDARRAVFLIDFGSTNEAAGEFEYVAWDSTGAYAPGDEAPPPQHFVRADANGDGALSISDPVFDLSALFSGGPQSPCLEATDSNDDGIHDITDPVFTLSWLFSGGDIPPDPSPFTRTSADCGPDPDPPGLGCEAHPGCDG